MELMMKYRQGLSPINFFDCNYSVSQSAYFQYLKKILERKDRKRRFRKDRKDLITSALRNSAF